jgi:nicotinate phosphoribosyltransferase
MVGDILTLEDDPQDGEPLLHPVMRSGHRLGPSPSLDQIRQHAATELARLPEHSRQLEVDPPYPVAITQSLHDLADAVDRQTSRPRSC